jgi:hypothetical protein
VAVNWEFIDSLASSFSSCKIVPGYRREWCVKGKAVAWERPLSKKDMAALGDAAPAGRVLAVHVPDVGVKQAWINAASGVCFDSPHFATYPAVLVNLELADEQLVRELFEETATWLNETRP